MTFTILLVLTASVWIVSPEVRAGGQQSAARFQQQWHLIPHAPFRRPPEPEVTARLTRQIDPLLTVLDAESTAAPETVADAMLESKVRNQLFRLESLLR